MRLVVLGVVWVWGCSFPSGESKHPSGVSDTSTAAPTPDADPGTDGEPETELDPDPEPADTAASSSGGDTATDPVVDCAMISAENPAWEVCETGPTACAGVFTDGAGCQAYCAAAGLVCTSRFGGEPGCQKEPENPIDCAASNGHQSDWCTCGPGDSSGTEDDDGDADCEGDPARPPVSVEMAYTDAVYSERHNWVLDCRDYAYSAHGSEHQDCDAAFHPDGGRTGTASFVFEDLPRGLYDAYMGGRHTENRNPSGALFTVDGHAAVIDQTTGADYTWDLHGQYCLEGRVEVVLDSTVNSGSDSVFGVRLEPAE